jgi:predicted lipoprotein with Yx(FWY)xxD motif
VDEYEFPGPDVPAMLNGEMVSPPFKVTGGTASAGGSTALPTEVVPAAQLIVDVTDQPIQDGTVTMNDVVSIGPGWLVIHIDDQGNPGEVIGFAPVRPGHNPNLAVKIDPAKATPVLFAMLHVDAGTVGTYEFPGPDIPAMENGQMVSPAFQASPGAGGQPAATVPAEPTPTQVKVLVVDHPQLGKILVDEKGLTLYLFTKDPPGQTVCTGGCAENWPPLLTTSGVPVAGEGLPGKLDVIARPDNGIQVTYKDIPLYYFEGDDKPGDVNGQGLGNVWFVLNP